MTSASRTQEIQDIHHKYLDFYRISGGLSLILIGIWIGSLVFKEGYATNLYTEFISVAATIAVLDQLNRRRAIQERKLALFRQAKSRSNDHALEAFDQIQHEDWWDELLEHYRDEEGQVDLSQVHWSGGIQLPFVHLENANLVNAHLENANLLFAHLENAYLGYVHLENASLVGVHLENANLGGAHLENAYLGYVHLENANLGGAHLENANLQYAQLKNANLCASSFRGVRYIETVSLNEKTVLPDATLLSQNDDGEWMYDKYWTSDTDMTRYTNPEHPDFWEPTWVKEERERQQKQSG